MPPALWPHSQSPSPFPERRDPPTPDQDTDELPALNQDTDELPALNQDTDELPALNRDTAALPPVPQGAGLPASPPAEDSPVFADHSGRRRKIAQRIGIGLAAVAAGYLSTLVIGLLGGPTAPYLPLPDDKPDPAKTAPATSQSPNGPRAETSGRSPEPTGPASPSPTSAPTSQAPTSSSSSPPSATSSTPTSSSQTSTTSSPSPSATTSPSAAGTDAAATSAVPTE